MKAQRPPKWADSFLEFYCKSEFLEEIQGDVHELYKLHFDTKGPAYARRRFVWDVLRFFKWSNIKSVKRSKLNSIGMFKNYLKISWRGLVRDKLYSLVNLSGLTVAITVFMLIFLYVKEETSYDRYHTNHANTYRVVSNLTTPGNYFEFAITPPHLGDRLKEDFPEVLSKVRLAPFSENLAYNNKAFDEESSLYADPGFFDLFSVPLLKGDASTALTEPFSIVLTETAAVKYFGDEDPFGKIMTVAGFKQPLSVTGVMKDVPKNTHFTTEVLVSMSTRNTLNIIRPGQWFYLDYYTFISVPEDFDKMSFEASLPAFIEKHIGKAQESANQTYQFELQKLSDIHLKSNRDVELAVNGNIQYIYIFSVVAMFILLLACVNFMNLSTARATRRAKEIGIRKVVGAIRRQLISQFLIESVMISLLSFMMALAITFSVLGAFNNLVDKELVFTDLLVQELPYFWMGIVLLVGLLAGIYPALFLSRFKAISILKSSRFSTGGSAILRKGLVVFQLMISTTLITGVIVINRQLQSMRNENLGFDQERMVLIDFSTNGDPSAVAEVMRNEFSKNAGVQNVSFSRFTPRAGALNWFTEYEKAPGELENTSMYGALIDFDFMDAYGVELVAGSGFDKTRSKDLDPVYMLNEAAVKKMGFASNEDALGKSVGQNGNIGLVIGVVKDFNFESLHNAIEPLILSISSPRFYSTVSVKLYPGDGLNTMAELEEAWNKTNPDKAFEAGFLDHRLDQLYSAEILTEKVFRIFSNLTAFIAALGLFALSTFAASRQQKAVSVRRVLGASSSKIALAFILQFVKLSLIAFAIATPITWLLAESWLKNFTYSVDISLSMLLLTAGVMLLVTVLTVSFQSLRIIRANPATILRSE